MTDSDRRKANLRLAWVLVAVAAGFVAVYVARRAILGT